MLRCSSLWQPIAQKIFSLCAFGSAFALLLFCTPIRACDFCENPERFEQEYLTTYFPKAFVSIEEYFTQMCPDAIATSLGSMVELLGERTYNYYKNHRENFEQGEYWENIVEQCKIVGDFLERARVENGIVVVPESSVFFDFDAMQESKQLLSVFHDKGQKAHFDFYAFYFDYNNKLFNEGIRFCLLAQAYHYSKELERLVEKLRGSRYEASYQEVVKRSKELIGLLRSRLGIEELQGTDAQIH